MKNKLILITLILMPLMGLRAETEIDNKFKKANELYEKGQFDQAYSIYQNLVAQNYKSPSLYYNIGNVFYRRGERGEAILWYERAKKLDPRDRDIKFNLKLSQSHIKKVPSSLFERVTLIFTTGELSWIFTIFIWIFFISLGLNILRLFQNELWSTFILWSSGLLLILSGVWLGLHLSMDKKPWAVVVNPPGEVRNGPGTDYAVGFTVPEGSKVLILNERPKWTEVGVPQEGLKGWMPTNEISAIAIQKINL